jgi:hypothetical protein
MRNKIALLCLIIVSINITMKAQTTDTTTYDTLIYYPLEVANCPTWLDSLGAQHVSYKTSHQLWLNTMVCRENYCHYDLDLVSALNYGYATGFAQPYHFTEPQKVCGVAAWVFGDIPNSPCNYKYFQIKDTNNNILDSITLPIFNIGINEIHGNTHLQPIPRHYFANGLHPEVQDFSIIVDSLVYAEYGSWTNNYYYFFDHSCTYDHDKCPGGDTDLAASYYISLDGYHIGCDVEEAPYLKKDGVWMSFTNDSIYSHYARKHIAWYPIILVPHFQQGINEVDISNTCGIYPNPATNSLSLISEFRVKNIEIYDMQGKKLKEVGVNEYQSQIDISSLPSGSYLMVIQTPQGNVNKKFIKQ